MTKLRFFLHMLVLILFIIATIFMTGLGLWLYTDIASFLLGIICPYIIISFIFTPNEQIQFTREIFKPVGNRDKKVLERAINYFKSFKSILLSSAVVWTIMGTIGILANLEDTSAIGPNFAVALIVPFYVSLFLILLIEPLKAAAEKNLKS